MMKFLLVRYIKKIQELIKSPDNDINLGKIADLTNLPQTTISNILNGKIKEENTRITQTEIIVNALEENGYNIFINIFLCHAQEDKADIEYIYQNLSAVGFKPWMDNMDLLPGQKWDIIIRESIRNSDFFIVCLTQNSCDKSGYLLKEIRLALDILQEKQDHEIFIIPVKLEECQIPQQLAEYQWMELYQQEGWERLFFALDESIKQKERRKKKVKSEPKIISLDLKKFNKTIPPRRYGEYLKILV